MNAKIFESVPAIEPYDKWGPVTTAWRVLRLRMEVRPPTWKVAANVLNKPFVDSRQGSVPPAWLGEGLKTSYCESESLLLNIHRHSFGPGLILWYEVTGEWRKLHNEELHDLKANLCYEIFTDTASDLD
jgi:hypothetical protein